MTIAGVGGENRPMLTELNAQVPDWVPDNAARYLAHTEGGLPIRELARLAGCHASTVLRQIRRLESRRDDTLVDEALRHLGKSLFRLDRQQRDEDGPIMIQTRTKIDLPADELKLCAESLRILRRLAENGAVLAVAENLENAVVVRQTPAGTQRTAVVARGIAQAMALKNWIACETTGKIMRYQITTAGRAELARLSGGNASGLAEAPANFSDQHREFDQRTVLDDEGGRRQIRYNTSESPLTSLARRKDKNGMPFLSEELVSAGERLREDFELAQMGPRVAQNWDRFLTVSDKGGLHSHQRDGGSGAARDRVAAALRALGPGLGDVVLRCCCFLEGLETAEKRMGWSARSGKIVLRIALQRLSKHYESLDPRYHMIG